MASLAFRVPWLMVEMSERINSRMANPAASSAALLIRRPDESLLVDVERLL
jgi:hypothetical protein